MRSVVIGGAGFIGSHLVDQLVERGPVVVVDNLSSGRREYINPRAIFVHHDVTQPFEMTPDVDVCFHLAANPDARHALTLTRTDLEQGTIATHNALDACRRARARPRFVFASSGTVYGDTPDCVSEHDLAHLPISLYGASKLAGEAMVSAFCHCFGMRGYILRFGNVVGSRATHGCIVDFLAQGRGGVRVLGDGEQRKPYLHVSDCVAAILRVLDCGGAANPDIYNVAPRDTTSVREIAELCADGAPVTFEGGDRGWAGDVPRSRMNATRLERLGWKCSMTSGEAVQRAVEELR